MTDIIRIPPGARLEALRRQLAQVQSDRVVLEVPEGWTELDNAARMRLLQRQAQIQRLDLGLLTRDEQTRKVAQQLGIPVFQRLEDVTRRPWRMQPPVPVVDPQRPEAGLPEPPPWRRAEIVQRTARPTLHQARRQRIRSEVAYRRPLPWWLPILGYVAMGSLLVAVLAFFGLYVLPAATITMVPGRENLEVVLRLTADPNLDEPDLEANLLPARLVETTLELHGSIPTTGSQQKPTDRATGVVIFSNLGTAPVNIPEGTIVSTSTGAPVSFRTTASAELPGGVGARVSVPIEALEPGIQGNVRANTINTVSGALRFRVRVINPDGTFGGGSRLVPVVSQQDRENLLAMLEEQAQAEAYPRLQQELQENEWLPPESVQIYTVAQVFDQFNDAEATELGLDLRVLVQGVALDQSVMSQAVLAALQRAIPERGKLVADSVVTQRQEGAQVIGQSVQFTMTARAEYVVPIDPAEVKSTVAGLSPAEAQAALMSRWLLTRPPDIYQDPDWLATLPSFPSRIQVRVEYDESVATQ
ncbi:hypothetical protein RY27_20360 [Litorilinea aerophila]|nr:hypothetical protein RY27_20360 [Litorilinea aerophila]